MWVIHTLGVSSTLIHIATRFGTSQDITQRSTAQRKTLRNAARRSATKKEDPPKRAFLQESSEQNRCTTTSS